MKMASKQYRLLALLVVVVVVEGVRPSYIRLDINTSGYNEMASKHYYRLSALLVVVVVVDGT